MGFTRESLRTPKTDQQLMRSNAWRKVGRAIASGRLVRPAACEKCRKLGRPLQAHHHDYSKPLDVTWLCIPCHQSVHLDLQAIEGRS